MFVALRFGYWDADRESKKHPDIATSKWCNYQLRARVYPRSLTHLPRKVCSSWACPPASQDVRAISLPARYVSGAILSQALLDLIFHTRGIAYWPRRPCLTPRMNNRNNNDTSNATPGAIAPNCPPDPTGVTATAQTRSYSAAVSARSHAKTNATPATATTVASHPMIHNIANCVIIKTPPATTSEKVLSALDHHYPSLAGAMPCVIKGQHGIRFPKDADIVGRVANGLTVGKTLCQVEKLFSATTGVIQCTLSGFFSDVEGLRLFDEQIAEYGKVLLRRTHYIGKTRHISGVYDFVLALEDPNKLPPASISIVHDGVTERIPLRITGGMRHCVFCRSAAHVRKDCPVAPACKSCASTSHASQHCPGRRLASSPQGTPESRPAQASTVTKAPPASKSIPAPPAPDRASKTKKRRVDPDQDLAAQPQDPSNRAQPEPLSETPRPEFSFNFPPNSAPLPASNQGTAPPLVEKSSESPSSETTPPPPSPPPATPTPKMIVTRSQSIAVLSTPATRDDPPTTPAPEASEPTPRPPSLLPSAAPKA
ncbi:BQ5605_C029g10596 [Microbotryum silenes-dioicae]|uniref:BQ5605_C029g10596 protein n=1 Tax=Microbotryum silenes-dioicae TaxID=796604 RepID=A0A2X0MIZ8_9BASI|nr:BQ5605_C029g10596 [Microbotryum silenes-dioicae]